MVLKHRLLFTLALLCFTVISCRQRSVDGIIIGSNLYDMQTVSTNKQLRNIIEKILNKNQSALIELTDYWCGGASGCYDLGYVLTQIINKMGEKEFIKLTQGLTKNKKEQVINLIEAGLEYGDNDYDGKMDDTTIRKMFPNLEIALNK